MQRMTKQSRENVKAAIEARVHLMAGAFTVELIGASGARAWVSCPDGPVRYHSYELARRAVRRLAPKLPTSPVANI